MKPFLILILILLPGLVFSQKAAKSDKKIKVKLDLVDWDLKSSAAELTDHNGTSSLHIKKSEAPILYKNLIFSNGTIEYDIDPDDEDFCGIYFRAKDNQNAEYFYLRMDAAGKPNWHDGIQYAPTLNGLTYWILMDYYQGSATFEKHKWNHIKLVISGSQMLAYVNNMDHPALLVDHLDDSFKEGLIGFDGNSYITNVVISPGTTEGLSPVAGLDITQNDPRYLRKWKYSKPVDLPIGTEPLIENLPANEANWNEISSERHGLVNFSRLYNRSQKRRLIWLKVKLRSPIDQVRYLDLGFSDEVWGFINKEIVFADKNLYFDAIRKDPGGRVSVQNGHYKIPLKAGDNDLVIGLANNYFGWGIIAHLDSMKGLEIINQ